jgi:hypothetical protein
MIVDVAATVGSVLRVWSINRRRVLPGQFTDTGDMVPVKFKSRLQFSNLSTWWGCMYQKMC